MPPENFNKPSFNQRFNNNNNNFNNQRGGGRNDFNKYGPGNHNSRNGFQQNHKNGHQNHIQQHNIEQKDVMVYQNMPIMINNMQGQNGGYIMTLPPDQNMQQQIPAQ